MSKFNSESSTTIHILFCQLKCRNDTAQRLQCEVTGQKTDMLPAFSIKVNGIKAVMWPM